jgi:hypothetical protein
MKKWKPEELKVGKASMFAVTVPVLLDFDEFYEPEDESEESEVRIQLLKVGEYWLVITESVYDGELISDYACFAGRDDALGYLNLLGFEIEDAPLE